MKKKIPAIMLFYCMIAAQAQAFSNANLEQTLIKNDASLDSVDALSQAQQLFTSLSYQDPKAIFNAYEMAWWQLISPGTHDIKRAAQFAIPIFYQLLTTSFNWAIQAHLNKQHYPALQGVYTALWTGLGERGWSLWHEDCLKKMAFLNNQKRLLYVAGGTDIPALLSTGIYNIDIIDPFSSSQERYYCPNYEWLTGKSSSCQEGDKWQDFFGNQELTLERAKLSKVPYLYCVWNIKDKNQTLLGNITFSHRLIEQQDFVTPSAIVISYNELIFLCLPQVLGGWAVDIKQWPAGRQLYVKQLPDPLNISMLLNLRALLTLSYIDFKFIALGSDIE